MRILFCFQDNLRLRENTSWFLACQKAHETGGSITPVYCHDPQKPLGKRQKSWLYGSLIKLQAELRQNHLDLFCLIQSPLKWISGHCIAHSFEAIYTQKRHDPLGREQEKALQAWCKIHGISLSLYEDQLLMSPEDITPQSGSFFRVYTPFWKALSARSIPSMSSLPPFPALYPLSEADPLDALHTIKTHNPHGAYPIVEDLSQHHLKASSAHLENWVTSERYEPGEQQAKGCFQTFLSQGLTHYHEKRDIPAVSGVSRLSPYLRFGEISVRGLWHGVEPWRDWAPKAVERFRAELVWREFAYHTLYHCPSLPTEVYQKAFMAFPWHYHEPWFEKWCLGLTGFPMVDAGMRELASTGYMHNRVRMIVASFLTKTLLIDWRYGAAWFWEMLWDADLANNSMSWQWVAGTGLDAAPYFRIFNPILQSQKFDPQGIYIRRWVPELASFDSDAIHFPDTITRSSLGYPQPLVDHAKQRELALQAYQNIKKRES